jgi:hypothetical protein
MKNEKDMDVSRDTKLAAHRKATLALAANLSRTYELNGMMPVEGPLEGGAFIRFRKKRTKRFGQVSEKSMCPEMLEETVMINLLALQLECFYDVLSGNPENQEHISDCRRYVQRYMGEYEYQLKYEPMEMISMGVHFLGRNWRSIAKLARELLSHDKECMCADRAREILNACPAGCPLLPAHILPAREGQAIAS